MLKDSGGALRDFDRAVKISPHSAHIYFNRANLYASTGAHQKAERDYTKSKYDVISHKSVRVDGCAPENRSRLHQE